MLFKERVVTGTAWYTGTVSVTRGVFLGINVSYRMTGMKTNHYIT